VDATLDDYRWLVSDAATPWLAMIHELSVKFVTTALVERLRRDLSRERAALVIEQVELRDRAREKSSLAQRMFFTRKGLEQATDERLAQYKAARFPASGSIADLCCGIGGDLLALAEHSTATGVDLDAISVVLAEANARVNSLNEDRCQIIVGDAADFAVDSCRAWHADPDRRPAGRRTSQAAFSRPSPDEIDRLLTANSRAAIKLAPAAGAPPAWQHAAEREWLGSRGECRQQVVWFADLAAYPGRRTATVVGKQGQTRTIVENQDDQAPVATTLGRYLFEPHAAVLAAKLTNAISREHRLAAVSPGVAYFTGDRAIDDLLLDVFEIHDVLPFDRKRLKSYCRERSIGRLEIKKRGVEIEPETLRKQIVQRGDASATLIVAPIAGQVKAIIAQRVISSNA